MPRRADLTPWGGSGAWPRYGGETLSGESYYKPLAGLHCGIWSGSSLVRSVRCQRSRPWLPQSARPADT